METPRHVRLLCAVLATALVLAQGLAAAPPAQRPPASGDRVQRLLGELEKVQTAEQAAQLIENARLGEDELTTLARRLSEPAWSPRVERFNRGMKRSVPAKPTDRRRAGQDAAGVLAERRKAAVVAHDKRLQASSALVRARRQELQLLVVAAPLGAAGPGTTAPRTAALPPLPRGPREWPATIRALSPDAAEVGARVTIEGSGFGSGRGAIVFLRGRERVESTSIESWTATRITARVPPEFLPWRSPVEQMPVGAGGAEGELWVRLSDGRWGGGHAFRVMPDPATVLPVVRSMTPSELVPGEAFLIEGANFGSMVRSNDTRGVPPVQLDFAGTKIRAVVEDWQPNAVSARVPDDLGGLARITGGTVTVRNRLGLEGRRAGLTFVPIDELLEVAARPIKVTCHPAGNPLFCWAGDSLTVDVFEAELRNGWTVEDSWLDVNDRGVNAGAFWVHQPQPGSTRPNGRVTVWADGLSQVACLPHLVIKGPRGTSYR